MNTASTLRPFVSVRWSFRLLAALFLVSMVVGYAFAAISRWQGNRLFGSYEETLLLLPLNLWLARLFLFAAAKGSVPRSENAWPFASERVLGAYFLLVMFFLFNR